MSTKITRRNKATIYLEEMSVLNTEGNDSDESTDEGVKDTFLKKSKYIGDIAPFIRIQEFTFTYTDILFLEINTSGFLPKIRVNVIDSTGAFGEAYFPKTSPILSLYIRSKNEKLKSIRNDYIITNVFSDRAPETSDSSENIRSTYTITGELLVPKLKNEFSESIDATSFDVLMDLSKKMELGFSSNVDSTNDQMIWISNWVNTQEFIEYDITKHAYYDENAFYNTFVDIYYNLNFINIYDMLDGEFIDDEVNQTYIKTIDYLRNNGDNRPDYTSANILTNWSAFKETSQFINGFSPITRQGKLLNKFGYAKNIQYYDALIDGDLKDKFVSFYSRPYGIVVPDSNSKNTNLKELKNRIIDDYRGIDYGNSHSNYKFSEILNETGINELSKINVEVELNDINLTVMKNMQIQIMIMKEGTDPENNAIFYKTQENSKYQKLYEKTGILIDKNYSGKYVVNNIRYVYDPFSNPNDRYLFKTILTLTKTGWDDSPKILKDIKEIILGNNK